MTMKSNVNWWQVIAKVIEVVLLALAGGGGAMTLLN